MSTPQELTQATEGSREAASAGCRGTTFRLGVCPPCLLVGGMVAVFVLGRVVLEVFR